MSENSILDAIDSNDILAVGCVIDDGEITLNYVSPDARFRGVSTALLAALEKRAIECGNEVCRLKSTETARRFYLVRGYSEHGSASRKFGTRAFSVSIESKRSSRFLILTRFLDANRLHFAGKRYS